MSGTRPVGRFDPDAAIYIAIGGNLPVNGQPVQATLEQAIARLDQNGVRVLARSRWWRSEAWPDPADPSFLNGVIAARSSLTPISLIDLLHRLEAEAGRQRSSPNAPRPLDLDLIAFGREVLAGPDLVVPHPRADQRLFVMGPLAEIAPDWRHPALGATAAELAASAAIGVDARPVSL